MESADIRVLYRNDNNYELVVIMPPERNEFSLTKR